MSDSIDNKIILRAMKDADFRKRLLDNPSETLSKEFGMSMPAGLKLQVHEEDDTVRHLVLPKAPAAASKELSDSQLEAAAGGMPKSGGKSCCCTCGISTHQTLVDTYNL